MSGDTVDVKALAAKQAKIGLREFLESKRLLHLPRADRPRLSILLVLYNRVELTLACLRSLQPYLQECAAEVVLVDNASHDETGALLDRIRGATVIRNPDNRGFPRGVNQAAEAAAGDFLLLLNNDTEVLGDSLEVSLRFLESHGDVGAVGGRLILLDGTLQEAGCTIWREGHVLQYGRGDDPRAPQFLFQRDVDYCSAAFLMTRRDLFARMGGLDEGFSPGYFEDVDYCVRLWRAGWRVVYLPDVAVLHYENASSSCRQELSQLYRRNHVRFTHKHADWLPWQCSADTTTPLRARGSHDDRFKVLYLPTREAIAPSAEIESRFAPLVQRLRAGHCFVTIYPVGGAPADRETTADELPADVEVLSGGDLESLPRFLEQRCSSYDCILASDPQVLERVRRHVKQVFPAA